MKVTQISIKNFRLLEDVELCLEDGATVIVGRNTSGKTSLTELFRRLLREGLVDLPLLHQAHHKLDLLLAHGSLVAYALPGEDALERLQQLALKTLSVVLGLALARQVRHRVQDVEPHAGVAGLGRTTPGGAGPGRARCQLSAAASR